MPKKGSRSTHRVRFEWSSGIKGVVACYSKDEAEMKANEIRRAAEWREGFTVTVTIEPVVR